jgi:hypothetical protein
MDAFLARPKGGASQPDATEPPARRTKLAPLADRMRPETVATMVGQQHLLGAASLLRTLIDKNTLPSLILWGPVRYTQLCRRLPLVAAVRSHIKQSKPGCGKTTLARTLAKNGRFVSLSAVTCGVAELKAALEEGRKQKQAYGTRTILFVGQWKVDGFVFAFFFPLSNLSPLCGCRRDSSVEQESTRRVSAVCRVWRRCSCGRDDGKSIV